MGSTLAHLALATGIKITRVCSKTTTNKMIPSIICLTLLIASAASHPLPQRLTEEEFRSLKIGGEDHDNSPIISNSYAKIRRQGRNHNGRSISFTKPFTVRDPLEFAAAGRNLIPTQREKIQKFPEMAPVFNLEDMLKAEAEKLREKVEKASLMAAKAVEEAEQKVQELAKESIGSSDIPEKEIEDMIEKIVDSAIDEAQEIIEEESETSTEQVLDYNSDEALNVVLEDEDTNLEETTENAQPSSDIDLGSVQEV